MDYNLRLKHILIRYSFYENDYGGPDIVNRSIEKNAEKVISKFKGNPRIGIWGGGEHTVALIKLKSISKLNIVGIYDNAEWLWNKKIKDFTIKDTREIEYDKVDIMLISSYLHRLDIKDEINNKYPYLKYIDIYEEDNESGHTLQLLDLMTSMSGYNIISFAIEDYRTNKTSEKLRQIICSYLNIKDFISSKIFIKEYIDSKYEEYEKMIEFDKELDKLLKDMKEDILKNNKKNILLIVSDSLRGKDVLVDEGDVQMPFTNQLQKDNMSFKNAFSPSTYTTESHRAIFCGKRLFEDDVFKVERVNDTNSMFIKELKRRGYNLCNYDTLRIIDNEVFDEIGTKEALKPMTKLMWDYLCYNIESENKKSFSYIRFMESHAPFASGYSTTVDQRVKGEKYVRIPNMEKDYKSYTESIRYIDYQLEFYLDMIKDDMLIITADHGNDFKHRYSKSGSPRIWGDNRIHVPLIIKKKSIKYTNQIIENLFSTKDLGKVMLNILDEKEISIEDKEYIVIERSPIYNEELKAKFMAKGINHMIQALRMIRTDREKYIIYQDGKEEYYLSGDEMENLISDKYHLDRINYFRNLKDNDVFPKFNNK